MGKPLVNTQFESINEARMVFFVREVLSKTTGWLSGPQEMEIKMDFRWLAHSEWMATTSEFVSIENDTEKPRFWNEWNDLQLVEYMCCAY